LDELVQDPANPRLHPERNKKAVRGSIKRFGAGRSILIDEGNVIVAGNEATNGFAAEGYNEVLVVEPGPGQFVAVRRSGLTATEKLGLAIADNQTALTAEWIPDLGDAINSLKIDGFDLSALGFDDDELNKYLGDTGAPNELPPPAMPLTGQFGVIVQCDSESHQEDVYNRLVGDGFKCRVVCV
jgi:hypothetical protein